MRCWLSKILSIRGVAARALQLSRGVEKPSGRVTYTVVLEGLCRFTVQELSTRGTYYTARISPSEMTKAGWWFSAFLYAVNWWKDVIFWIILIVSGNFSFLFFSFFFLLHFSFCNLFMLKLKSLLGDAMDMLLSCETLFYCIIAKMSVLHNIYFLGLISFTLWDKNRIQSLGLQNCVRFWCKF